MTQQFDITLLQMDKETTIDIDGQYVEWLDEIDLPKSIMTNQNNSSPSWRRQAKDNAKLEVTPCMQTSQLRLVHSKAIEAEVEAKRKATSSELAKATEPSKGAKNLTQEKPPGNGEPPACTSKPLSLQQGQSW